MFLTNAHLYGYAGAFKICMHVYGGYLSIKCVYNKPHIYFCSYAYSQYDLSLY